MGEMTDEMLATAIKYLSAKRQNLYRSVSGAYSIDPSQRDHLNTEIDKLNEVVAVLEVERERRRVSVT